MKAVVFSQKGKVETVEMEAPKPRMGQMLVEVKAAGLCGTDRSIVRGRAEAVPGVVLGHEFAGVIREIGEMVPSGFLDKAVVVDPNISCGVCGPCRRGAPHLCSFLMAYGVDLDGGFAEYCLVDMKQVHFFDSSVIPFELAAFAEPLSCCIHGLDRAQVRAGEAALVIGAGPVGIMLAQLLMVSGAGFIGITDRNKKRLQIAEELDLMVLTGGDLRRLKGQMDVVFEAAGTKSAEALALQYAGPGGRVVFFGKPAVGESLPLSPSLVFEKELTLLGSLLNPFTMSRAIEVLEADMLYLEELISHRISLEQLPSFLTRAPQEGEMKVMVLPGED